MVPLPKDSLAVEQDKCEHNLRRCATIADMLASFVVIENVLAERAGSKFT